jgi:hypothetical protein
MERNWITPDKKYIVTINGTDCQVKEDDFGEVIYYNGKWRRFMTDDDGLKYLNIKGKRVYSNFEPA